MLNPEVWRQAIRLSGEQVKWLKAMPCDCYDPASNYDHQRGCGHCLMGYLYREQTLPAGVQALVQQVKRSFLHPELGWVQEGQLQVTTMPEEIALGPLDRLVLLQREMEARERLVRGGTAPDTEGGLYTFAGSYAAGGAPGALPHAQDTVAHPYLVRIAEVSDSARVYVPRDDYNADPVAGTVVWLEGGQAPAPGAVYAVLYYYRPVYWFLSGEQTVPRPMPLTGGRGPIRGYLYWKRPGEG